MAPPNQPPGNLAPPKLLASARVKLQLAALSAVVLTAGALLAPRAASPPMVAPSQEHAAPLLGQQVQSRDSAPPFRGVQEVAARVRGSGVAIAPSVAAAAPTVSDFSTHHTWLTVAGFGVYVTDTHVLTHAAALEGRSSGHLTQPGREIGDAAVVAFDPATGLALLQAPPSGARAATIAATAPAPGSLAVAAGWAEGRDIAVPVFVTSAADGRFTSGALDPLIRPGMPLYTLDGELFAIAGDDERQPELIGVGDVTARLLARAASGEQLSSFGATFQSLTAALAAVFGERGVLIADVVDGGPADTAGLAPGDVLLAISDRQVGDPDAAAAAIRALPVNTEVSCQILRAGRTRTVAVTPVTAYEAFAAARAAAGDVPDAPEARALFDARALERAGIAPGSRVLLVNGRVVATRAQAARERGRATGPVAILARDRGRQYFAAIEPAR